MCLLGLKINNIYQLTTYRYLKACYQTPKYACLKCEFWGWNDLFPLLMQIKLQLCILKPWRYLILHISGLFTQFYCYYFTIHLLYSFCVNFNCKIIVRAVSSVCTIRTDNSLFVKPDCDMTMNNNWEKLRFSVDSIFPAILWWKLGGISWKCSLFLMSLKSK